jgi:hypothetical protein
LALLLPVMSVDGCGVGGRFGRGMMGVKALIERLSACVQLLLQLEKSRRGGKETVETMEGLHYHCWGVAWALLCRSWGKNEHAVFCLP